MVSTVKFSQFAAPNLSATNNMLAGVGSGANFRVDWPLSWTTALRPVAPKNGMLGYNTDLSQYEYWDAPAVEWIQLTAGGVGTVTQVNTGTGLTGGPIINTGTISFAAIAANSLWANTSGASAVPTVTPLSTFLLSANNLSDLTNAATARINIGLQIGVNVEAWNASLDQIAAGTWPGAVSITTLGTIAFGTWQSVAIGTIYGGTGLISYILGDILYGSATNVLSKLAGNTTATKLFLSQTGTGIVSAAPVWSTVSGGDVTGAALTKTDDTNVTLTLGGTPTTALLQATSLTLGWTGQLSLTRGGTNASLVASNGGIVYSSATALAILAGVATAGKVLQSGASSAPTWSTPTYPSTSGTAGQFLASDGTNIVYTSASFPVVPGSAGAIIISNGTSWISSTSLWPNTVGTVGKILRSDGTVNAYTTSTFADTYTASNLLYSNGANTVTGLATANDSVLVTSAGGVPSLSTTLPAGLTIPGYAHSGANSDITSMTGLTGVLQAPTFVNDSAGVHVLGFAGIASAVNYISISNTTTTNFPFFLTAGTDASIGMQFLSKASGVFQFASTTALNTELRLGSTDGIHYVGLKNPTVTSNITFILPGLDGSANFILKTNGSANLSFANGSQIAGTATNDNASAGNIGEFISSVVAGASPVNIPNNTATDITSISLTAGDWDVWGNIYFVIGGACTVNLGWINSSSATLVDNSLLCEFQADTTGTSLKNQGMSVPYKRISIASTTTVYISAYATFSTSTVTGCGGIYARRAR